MKVKRGSGSTGAVLRGIDHAVICVRDLDEAHDTFSRMGFSLTPRGHHSLGSRNHLAMFGSDYLELFSLPGASGDVPPAFAHFARFMESGDGLAALAIASDDAGAASRALTATGIVIETPLALSRPIDLPDGTRREASFTLVNLADGETPGARLFICQHHTPDLVWRREHQAHANGATGIAAVAILCRDPVAVREAAQVHARVFGAAPLEIDEGLLVTTGGAPLAFVTERSLARRLPGVWITGKADPVPAALFFHVPDRDRAERVLRSGGFHPLRLPDGAIALGAAEAHGVALVFG